MADVLLGLHLRALVLLFLDPDFFFERVRSSFEAFLNSPMLLPSERPSSGSFRGPKMISAITRMMTSSGMPMEPNIGSAPAGVRAGTASLGGESSLQVLHRIIEIRSGRGQGKGVHSNDMRSVPARCPRPCFVIVVCALVGGLFGRSALVAQDQVPDQYKVFTAALSAVEDNYVGEVESDRLVYSAITGMLQTLDPHSSFMDPRSYAQMRERQEGRYYGLGITIKVVDGDVTVFNVFEGSPAYQKGLRRGDVIAQIEGEDTKGWTSEQAVGKLRGPRGTSVNISIRRAPATTS